MVDYNTDVVSRSISQPSRGERPAVNKSNRVTCMQIVQLSNACGCYHDNNANQDIQFADIYASASMHAFS
jgi:hypothetical protein